MMKYLFPAVMLTVLMTVLTGLAYPLAMTGLARFLFPHQARGSLVERDGKVLGSELIGQNFTSGRYFHGRPSATTDTDPSDPAKTVPSPYNASNSAGSNLGPTSKTLIDRVKKDTEELAAENPSAKVPVDLVTASASGLDPDITPAAALFQVPRVAKARGVSEERLRGLVAENTTGRFLGVLGEPHINVLKLNLALDKAFPIEGSDESKEKLPVPEELSAAPAPPPPSAAAAEEQAEARATEERNPPPTSEQSTQTPEPRAEAAPEEAAVSPPSTATAEAQAEARVTEEPNPPPATAPGEQTEEAAVPPPVPPVEIYPSAISRAYAREKLDVARVKTCSDQYRINAATNANGGLARSAYLKECKKRLKG